GPRARPARAGAPAVELDSVWFAYDGDEWVLRDCSFSVAPGERVAIVGATGEGKTTCARLLNRSYDVRQGRVLVDGIDVREWDLASLRRHVGIIFQDSVLFAGSIEDNLRLGADGAVSPAQLTRAIETSRAGFVTELPRGLGEMLGERGANVSHGQRQLLAIARALVYNPGVLVLDEATSSVDPESEALIRQAMTGLLAGMSASDSGATLDVDSSRTRTPGLNEATSSVDPESEALIRQAMTGLLAGRTSITIAHRLSTVHAADRILVLHRGRLHEDGTHTELLRRGGLYARLYELQTGAASA